MLLHVERKPVDGLCRRHIDVVRASVPRAELVDISSPIQSRLSGMGVVAQVEIEIAHVAEHHGIAVVGNGVGDGVAVPFSHGVPAVDGGEVWEQLLVDVVAMAHCRFLPTADAYTFGVGDVGNVVLSDRRHLSQDGLIVVSVAIDFGIRDMVSGPEVVSWGFVYEKDSAELIDSIKEVVRGSVYDALDHKNCDFPQIRGKIKDDLSKFIYQQTKRRLMILSIVLDM